MANAQQFFVFDQTGTEEGIALWRKRTEALIVRAAPALQVRAAPALVVVPPLPVVAPGRYGPIPPGWVERGPAHLRVKYIVHLCYATNRFWIYTPANADAAIFAAMARGETACFGSRSGSSQPNTGLGFKIFPKELKAHERFFLPNPILVGCEMGTRGEQEIAEILLNRDHDVEFIRDRNRQVDGRDLWVDRSYFIDVKTRARLWPRLFIQIAEINPDKRHA